VRDVALAAAPGLGLLLRYLHAPFNNNPPQSRGHN
jgi:hypothetical protein